MDFLEISDIPTTNKDVLEIKKLLSLGKFEKAGDLARNTLEYVSTDGDAIICNLALGFVCSLHTSDYRRTRTYFGGASGLSEGDMRVEIEKLNAKVYSLMGNKEDPAPVSNTSEFLKIPIPF